MNMNHVDMQLFENILVKWATGEHDFLEKREKISVLYDHILHQKP